MAQLINSVDVCVAPNGQSTFFKDVSKLSLPALAPVQVNIRTVSLHRNVSGLFSNIFSNITLCKQHARTNRDYEFSVRRMQIPDKEGILRAVVFVEPTNRKNGPPRPNEVRQCILPGDQLLRINDILIDKLSRTELSTLIEHSGPTIQLTVKATPEMTELYHPGPIYWRDASDSLMLPDTVKQQISMDIEEDERYWLIHKKGFTMVRLLEILRDGKMKIRVMDMEMVVDVTDLDKANADNFDRAKDLLNLRYINETSVLHVLRQRYGSNLFYTYGGPQNMICLASVAALPMVTLFKGCRKQQMPPHIYSSAQRAYRALQVSGKNQCIVLTGASGSGKTTQMRNLCHYFCEVAGWSVNSLSYETLSSALFVLETFGNCSTTFHDNATRFLQILSLSFDSAAALRFAHIQTFLLDSTRIIRLEDRNHAFHILRYLLDGAPGDVLESLNLDKIDRSTSNTMSNEDSKQIAEKCWTDLLDAFNKLKISKNEVRGIQCVLAAIIHLIYAQATQGSAQRSQFIRVQHAQHAASLLGLDLDLLTAVVFRRNSSQISRFSLSVRNLSGQDALDQFISSIYKELFDAIARLLNRCLGGKIQGCLASVTIVDYPGNNFTIGEDDEHQPCSLTDLVYNYVNERIAEFFVDTSFTEPMEIYKREQIDSGVEVLHRHPQELTRLIDQKQQLFNCTDIELRSSEKRGIMCILDEESLFPAATDDSFYERIFVHLADSDLIKRGSRVLTFILRHGRGSSSISYSVVGWIKAAQAGYIETSPQTLLRSSSDSAVVNLFLPLVNATSENDMSMKVRKATQTIKLDAAGLHVKSGFFADICVQLDCVITHMKRSAGLHFVHCIQPLSKRDSNLRTDELINISAVRKQLHSLSIVNAVRAASQGYPEHILYKYFKSWFHCLLNDQSKVNECMDDRAIADHILRECGAFTHRYRLGLSQVLLRCDLLDELEDRREIRLSGLVEQFQHACRKFLSLKWLTKRRVQEIAIRCIQRNGHVYARVREWSWWRLYTRVSPLLVAARGDRENREWERKLEEKESTIMHLRATNCALEVRVAELDHLLNIERGSVQSISDAFERELEQRVHAEKQLLLLQHRLQDSKEESKLYSSSSHSRLDQSLFVDAKVQEIQKEMLAAKESEESHRLRAQKAVQQLKDLENEIKYLRAQNEMLEKKQKTFDPEMQTLKDKYSHEMESRIRAEREKTEVHSICERRFVELQNLKAENGELRQQVSKLRKDLKVENNKNDYGPENEVLSLQKVKRSLEMRCNEQEDELEEMTIKIKMLEQTVTRLEMTSERIRVDRIRDIEAKDSEIEELRTQYQRRVRALEDQIADLQEANASLLKHNRVIEDRSRDLDNCNYCSSDNSSGHYKLALKKAITLLRDTQHTLERERENSSNRTMIRQLQEQLGDVESAKLSALRSRHSLESELAEIKNLLESALTLKNTADNKVLVLTKEKNSALALVEEHDEQMQNLLKKYKAAVQQSVVDSIKIADQYEQIADLEKENKKLREELNDVTLTLEFHQQHSVEKHKLLLAEQKIRDLEGKFELECLQRQRLEALMVKANDELESLRDQLQDVKSNREKDQNVIRKSRKDVANCQEQLEEMQKREMDLIHKYKKSVMEQEKIELEKQAMAVELRYSGQRIKTLQDALELDLCRDGDDDQVFDEEDFEIPTHNGPSDGSVVRGTKT